MSNQNEPPIEDNGRTVVIRGPEGEIIMSSSNKKDTLKELADRAREQYNKQRGDEPGPRAYYG